LYLNHVVIIGTGTLGGHLCKHLAESSQINKLTIIDKDIVDTKDTILGIFNPIDVGEPKVNILKTSLFTHNVEIEARAELYIDGITELPESDLVIDCRNVFGKRDLNIDVKMYISRRYLILDFQKGEKTGTTQKGEYVIKLEKYEINRAAYYAKDLLCSNILPELIKNQSVKYINIDIIQSIMLKNIDSSKNKPDILYEVDCNICRLTNVEEVVAPILEKNKHSPLKVIVEGRQPLVKQVFNMPDPPKSNYKIIPQNELKTPQQVIEMLGNSIEGADRTIRFLPIISGNEIHIVQEFGGA